MSKKIELSGVLSLHNSGGEWHNALYLSSIEEPLAEYFGDEFRCKQVSVYYYITDMQCTKEEAQEDFLLQTLGGDVDARLCARYSDITGYLWTDEDLKIGGHDLLAELQSSVGKWLILTVEAHK